MKTTINKTAEEKNKKKLPLISIIIPVYNTEKYLVRCLESIITNTYKNLEIICVDDGSTDYSLNILSHYEQKDKRVRVIKQDKKGPSAARNMGLDVATGDYISFVDSDDFVSWNAYEILSTVLQQHDLDIIMFGANTFASNDVPNWIYETINTRYHYYKDCDGCRVAFNEKASRPFLWLHCVKRELFEKHPKIRFDEEMEIGEDQLVQFQYIPRAKNIMVIDDKLYNYRISRSGSLMQIYSSRQNKKVETHLLLAQKLIDAWKKEGIFENNQGLMVTWLVNFLYYSITGLPMSFKKKYATEIVELFEKNDVALYLMAEWERPRYDEMLMWSKTEKSDAEDLEILRGMIEQEKYEISETLKSRAFKLGKLFTCKSKRLNYEQFSDLIK